VTRVSGAHLRGFTPGPTHQDCNDGESLATCGRFDRLGIWTPWSKRLIVIWIIWPVVFSKSLYSCFIVLGNSKSVSFGNVQISYGALGEEENFSNRQRAVICGKGDLAKSSYYFYSGWKSLIYSSSCSIYGISGGRKLVENAIRGEVGRKRPNTVIWEEGV